MTTLRKAKTKAKTLTPLESVEAKAFEAPKPTNFFNQGETVAVGDIHGKFDLFTGLLNAARDTGARIVLLGDLIDRGPQSYEVVAVAKELNLAPEKWGLESFDVLKGNHEAMFVDAFYGGIHENMQWASNGADLANYHKLIPHVEWLDNLPYWKTVDRCILVHAGLKPGTDPAKTDPETLTWIREPFLDHGAKLERWTKDFDTVIHGHTIENPGMPTAGVGRINLDSGAYYSGKLTAYNLTQQKFVQFSDPEKTLPRVNRSLTTYNGKGLKSTSDSEMEYDALISKLANRVSEAETGTKDWERGVGKALALSDEW